MKVRLKLDKSFTELRVIRFQFHEGPIKTRVAKDSREVDISFNSMKVRLKQGGQRSEGGEHAVSIP